MGRFRLRTPYVSMARDQIQAGVWYKVNMLPCVCARALRPARPRCP